MEAAPAAGRRKAEWSAQWESPERGHPGPSCQLAHGQSAEPSPTSLLYLRFSTTTLPAAFR
jgi:hypothetical protein